MDKKMVEMEVMKFKMLDDDAKETAKEELQSWLNDDVRWHIENEIQQFCEESWAGGKWNGESQRTLMDIGLKADPKNIRSHEFNGYRGTDHFIPEEIWIEDCEKFADYLELDKRSWEYRDMKKGWAEQELSISIRAAQGYCHSWNVICEVEYNPMDDDISDELYNWRIEKAEKLAGLIRESVYEFLQEFVQIVNKGIEWIYSDEYIDDLCEANELYFFADGKEYSL